MLEALRLALDTLVRRLHGRQVPATIDVNTLVERCREFCDAYDGGDKKALGGKDFKQFLDLVEKTLVALGHSPVSTAERTGFWK